MKCLLARRAEGLCLNLSHAYTSAVRFSSSEQRGAPSVGKAVLHWLVSWAVGMPFLVLFVAVPPLAGQDLALGASPTPAPMITSGML